MNMAVRQKDLPGLHVSVSHKLLVMNPGADNDQSQELVLPLREAKAVLGQTVREFLDSSGWTFELPTVVRINGEYYSRAEWETYHLSANDNVEVLSRPMGSGAGPGHGNTAKTIGAMVALVALTAFAGPLGGMVAGALGATSVAAATFASALILGAGALAVSWYLKPPSGAQTQGGDKSLFSFAFGGNAARAMQPIPVAFGRTISMPDFAAPRYSEYRGESMHEYALFSLGCGDYDVEEIRIGDLWVWKKPNKSGPPVYGRLKTGYNQGGLEAVEIELVPPGAEVTLFPVNVQTTEGVDGIELGQTWSSSFPVPDQGKESHKLLVDLIWPSGCFSVNDNGGFEPRSVPITIQARRINLNDDNFAAGSTWIDAYQKTFQFRKRSQIRETVEIDLETGGLVPGRYMIRVTRGNEELKKDGADKVMWSALRGHIKAPQSFPGVFTVAVHAKANRKLNGVGGQQLSVIKTKRLRTWNGTAWRTETSRSIAWAAYEMWTNKEWGAGLPESLIDMASFLNYDTFWNSLGHTFDHEFREPQTLDECLTTILRCGRAFPAFIGDRLTIVREEPRPPRMMFTDHDMVPDSLSLEYVFSDETWNDGIIGQYIDETTLKPAQVSSLPNGALPARPTYVTLAGVTKRAQALGMVRFMAAESLYRRIVARWTTRLEGKLLKRGDQVLLASEIPTEWASSHEAYDYVQDPVSLVTNIRLDPAPLWYGSENMVANSPFMEGAGWSGTATLAANVSPSPDEDTVVGMAFTLTDTSTTQAQSRQYVLAENIPRTTEDVYVFQWKVQKRGNARPASRFQARLAGSASPQTATLIFMQGPGSVIAGVDTPEMKTGISDAGGYWIIWAAIRSNGTAHTSVEMELWPAYSAANTGTADVAQSNSLVIADPMISVMKDMPVTPPSYVEGPEAIPDKWFITARTRTGEAWGPIRITRGPTWDVIRIAQSHIDEADADPANPGSFVAALGRSATQDPPVIAFSPAESRLFKALVVSGQPDQDGEHIGLEAVIDDPRVYNIDEAGVPPLPTTPPIFHKALPVIANIAVNTYQRGLEMVLAAQWSPAKGAVRYEAGYSMDDGASYQAIPDVGSFTTVELNVPSASTFRVRVRGFTTDGQPGPWSVSPQAEGATLKVSRDFVTFELGLTPQDFESELTRTIMFQPSVDMVAVQAVEAQTMAMQATKEARAVHQQIYQVEATTKQAMATLGDNIRVEMLARNAETLRFIAEIDETLQTVATAEMASAVARQIVSAELGASLGDMKGQTVSAAIAAVETTASGKVTAEEAAAAAETAVSAAIGNLGRNPDGSKITVRQSIEAVTSKAEGGLGRWAVTINSENGQDNMVTGFELTTESGVAGETRSQFRIAADRFLVGGASSGTATRVPPRAIFMVETPTAANGLAAARVAIDGDLIATGTIKSNRLEAKTLSAISANLGNITAGTISLTSRRGSVYIYSGTTPRIEIWG